MTMHDLFSQHLSFDSHAILHVLFHPSPGSRCMR